MAGTTEIQMNNLLRLIVYPDQKNQPININVCARDDLSPFYYAKIPPCILQDQYFQKQKRHMDFYFHAPYAIIKYLIKAVLVTAPAHVAPGLLKWFVWYPNCENLLSL